jgi:hypothetical protein
MSAQAGAAAGPFGNLAKFLEGWFVIYGSNPQYEIEARVKDVDAVEFAYIKRQLDKNPAWHSRSVVSTLDTMHRQRVRKTVVLDAAAEQTTCLVKTKIEQQDIMAPIPGSRRPEPVRFGCSTEVSAEAPGADDPPTLYRLKKRYSYNHKREFLYELTEVRSGYTMAEAEGASTEYEVELEWCGSSLFRSYYAAAGVAPPPGQNSNAAAIALQEANAKVGALLAAKMCMKILDLLTMKLSAHNQPPAPAVAPAAAPAVARPAPPSASSAASSAASVAAPAAPHATAGMKRKREDESTAMSAAETHEPAEKQRRLEPKPEEGEEADAGEHKAQRGSERDES